VRGRNQLTTRQQLKKVQDSVRGGLQPKTKACRRRVVVKENAGAVIGGTNTEGDIQSTRNRHPGKGEGGGEKKEKKKKLGPDFW